MGVGKVGPEEAALLTITGDGEEVGPEEAGFSRCSHHHQPPSANPATRISATSLRRIPPRCGDCFRPEDFKRTRRV